MDLAANMQARLAKIFALLSGFKKNVRKKWIEPGKPIP
jgi:hypothetical protein